MDGNLVKKSSRGNTSMRRQYFKKKDEEAKGKATFTYSEK